MSEAKVKSDLWTGRDPSRAARLEFSPATHRKLGKLSFAIGGVGLFLLGYNFATFHHWSGLIIPAAIAVQGFAAGASEWKRSST
ncbi:MAG: hypothetical protein EOO77_03965 [Oxalobacteraceae bacterium]|nr:MAG: hypothetical protein EOO77_03965 [Oxalobacteraceae bacterium]